MVSDEYLPLVNYLAKPPSRVHIDSNPLNFYLNDADGLNGTDHGLSAGEYPFLYEGTKTCHRSLAIIE